MKPGLGRGLDALINPNMNRSDETPIAVSTKRLTSDDGNSYDILVKVSVNNIVPNPYQPRTEFEPTALDELKKSILENGLIQPITVRRKGHGNYELISGERRLRACKAIGYKEIPAYIIKVDTNEAMLALSLIENIQREKLNPIEIAVAYKRLMEECELSQEEIAKRVGKERSTVTNSIRLLKLPKQVQVSLAKEELSAGHARALINLPTEKLQLEILALIKKQDLSVRKVEALVKEAITGTKILETPKKTKAVTPESISQAEVENRLRRIFGTKVNCKQKKDGSGEVVIEFYSNDEFERLYELFELLDSNYS
ncbi:MAG: ParB/RepB/Spo0J family partition protein [Melioribacteraceae bacterium]|nr:ParB/RepB/Spo0J family partition protein [Melioribacteraceae bacterium]